MKIKLNQKWSAFGKDISEFFQLLKELDEITFIKKVMSQEIKVYSVLTQSQDCKEAALFNFNQPLNLMSDMLEQSMEDHRKAGIRCLRFEPEATPRLGTFNIETLRRKGLDEELLSDLVNSSKALLGYEDQAYIVSPIASTSLNQRAALGGETFSTPSVSQAEEWFKSFQWRVPQEISLVVRRQQDTKVVFAARSGAYTPIKQSTLHELYDKITEDFGTAKCREWYCDHNISGCFVEFPEIGAEISKVYKLPNPCIPGLYLATSDTGDLSLTVSGYWNFNGKILLGESNKLLHRGKLSLDKFSDDTKNKVFAKYNTVPERLCELLTIDVSSPVETLKSVFAQIGINKVIGKKREKLLLAAMSAEFIPGMKYTAYDIATAIADVTDRISGLSRIYKDMLSATVTKAIFADYTKVKDDGNLLLV